MAWLTLAAALALLSLWHFVESVSWQLSAMAALALFMVGLTLAYRRLLRYERDERKNDADEQQRLADRLGADLSAALDARVLAEARLGAVEAALEDRWTTEGLETTIDDTGIFQGLRVTAVSVKAVVRIQPIQLRAEFSDPVTDVKATRAAFGLYDQDDELTINLSEDMKVVRVFHHDALDVGEELLLAAYAPDWLKVVVRRLPG